MDVPTTTTPDTAAATVNVEPSVPLRDEHFNSTFWNVRLEKDFVNYTELCKYVAQVSEIDKPVETDLLAQALTMMSTLNDNKVPNDSSLGGNEALNPMWGFCVDDDIVHPIGTLSVSGAMDGSGSRGMGRRYGEIYDNNQQLLHLMFGKATYSGLAKFLGSAGDSTLAKIMGAHDTDSAIGANLARLVDSAGRAVLSLPFAPLSMLIKTTRLSNEYPVSKFVNFVPSMMTYYRLVNTILLTLAEGMGLGAVSHIGSVAKTLDPLTSGGIREDDLSALYTEVGPPKVVQDGVDIITILNRRHRRANSSEKILKFEDVQGDNNSNTSLGHMFEQLVDGASEAMSKLSDSTAAFQQSLYNGYFYLSFRVERSDNAAESISNSVGPSELASKMNAQSSQGIEKRFATGSLVTTGIDSIDKITSGIMDWAKSGLSKITFGALDSTIEQIMGSGFYDFPDIWKGSNFSKSYTFHLHLHSRYGDPVSIFQSVYVPLAAILAGAMPRGVGPNMYTAPFMVRAYCKGQFAIPLGIIESVSITRGASEHGWTYGYLPTSVDVSLTIRDLSPVLFLGMAHSETALMDIFRCNSPFTEYLTTLSGIGLKDRLFSLPNVRRKLIRFMEQNRRTKFSATYWQTYLGMTDTAQSIAAILPWNDVSAK